MTSNWLFNKKEIQDEEIPSNAIGFLYKITHISSNKFYYGRKLLTKVKTRSSKGKKIREKVESDWKDYYSSSPELTQFVEQEGKDKFKREILMFVTTKACLVLGEEYILHVTGALFDPMCFNSNIRAKIYRKWFNKTPNFFNELKLIKL